MLQRLFAVAVILLGWFGIAGAQAAECDLREAGFDYLMADQGDRAWKYTLKLNSGEWRMSPGGFHSTGYLELGPNDRAPLAEGMFYLRPPVSEYSCGSRPVGSDTMRWPASAAERVAYDCESLGHRRVLHDLVVKSVIELLKLGLLEGYAIRYAFSLEHEEGNLFVLAVRDACAAFETTIVFSGDQKAASARFHELAGALTVEREPAPPRYGSEYDPLAEIGGTIWDYFEREAASR